jgi:thiamine transporter ThiT
MKNQYVKRLCLAAMFLAIGLVLPLFTGQIKEIGDSLLPMHLPVFLCGLICGWKYGGAVGLILPFLRSVTFGMPPLYPNAVWMALELATYGLVIGLLFSRKKEYSRVYLLVCLVISMLSGRVVWGVTKAVLLGVAGKPFGLEAFLVGGFADAVPGLILQFILIPLIMEVVYRSRAGKKTK